MKMRRVLEVKPVFDGPYVKLYDCIYLNKNSQKRNWRFASRRDDPLCMSNKIVSEAVTIIPIYYGENVNSFETECPEIVVTKEYRASLGGYEYGCPAGLIENEENVEEAARRELLEETGLIMDTVLYVTPPLYSSAGLTDEATQTVFVDCHGKPSVSLNEEDEDIEILIMTFGDMWDIINHVSDRFSDGRISSKAYLGWLAVLSNKDGEGNYNQLWKRRS